MNHLSAEELQTLLQHGRYSIENFDTLKRVLSDAFTLYDIMAGKSRLSDLLTTIEKKADPEAFSLVIFDLARFLRPRLQKAVAEILELQQDHATTLADSFAPILEYRLAAMQAVKQRIRNLWLRRGLRTLPACRLSIRKSANKFAVMSLRSAGLNVATSVTWTGFSASV